MFSLLSSIRRAEREAEALVEKRRKEYTWLVRQVRKAGSISLADGVTLAHRTNTDPNMLYVSLSGSELLMISVSEHVPCFNTRCGTVDAAWCGYGLSRKDVILSIQEWVFNERSAAQEKEEK